MYYQYIKYPINYSEIYNLLNRQNKKTVTFFIDLQSIAKGLFNKKVIELELSNYDEKGNIPFTLPFELFEFIKGLNIKFNRYDPFFVIFFDNGACNYHTTIDKSYKANRTIMFDDQVLAHLFVKLKKLYFETIYNDFNKYENVIAIYLQNYEADFVPHYIIQKNYFDLQNEENLNIILSTDKDLLQTCKFSNTIQCITSYRKNKYIQKIYDNRNAISYIYSNFKPGILTAEYIPLLLSITGDKSDNIEGIKGYGPKKAIDLIIKYQLKPDLSNIETLLENNVVNEKQIKTIQKNYSLISFDYMINKISEKPLKYIDNFFV